MKMIGPQAIRNLARSLRHACSPEPGNELVSRHLLEGSELMTVSV